MSLIYRHNFSKELTVLLRDFSKIHQFDDRKEYKVCWEGWVRENDDIIQKEIERLSEINYQGDILKKMFNASRYYFRKKSSEKKPVERKVYKSCNKELLIAIDEHIKTNTELKPSDSFDDFCRNNIEIIKTEIVHLIRQNYSEYKEIQNKIKKTYKNRYYRIHS